MGILGSLVTGAIMAIAAFSFATSRNVAVMNSNVEILKTAIDRMEPRIRKLEEDMIRLQAQRTGR
jgi:hypothetical protein